MGKQGAGKGSGGDDAHARRQAVIDGLLADALRPAVHRPPSQDALAADIRQAIDRLLAKAESQRSRCLTYDDLEEALPPRDVSAEDLEAIFWILAEHGIEVEDGEA
ncbi:RNA polymerase sigma factor region1.1 domain-containing protein [Methylobacterium sp. J-070]|uniref:RNA polymerase sigma factor region1.1 domain-containing protein n=1 Tax=Methylobacterium sp. J-070 TaxID=2836650 RepID=UPI001FBB2714|nr:RNA polymerase sigma factor region1.1 domain-containing protein [Methylobacterium sp. J-070]MCJ2050456.1 RNA polymerase sigma factor region1.1 domain-containing protein [Methylobacterium sp. J-070]